MDISPAEHLRRKIAATEKALPIYERETSIYNALLVRLADLRSDLKKLEKTAPSVKPGVPPSGTARIPPSGRGKKTKKKTKGKQVAIEILKAIKATGR